MTVSFSRSQKGRPGLYGAVGQAVPQLVGDYLRPRQRLPRLRRLCDGEVADAYVAYLPARDELLHGLHRLLDGELVARPVQLVKVDVLDAQPLYAALARGQDVFVPKVLRRDLRGDEDFVPDILDRCPTNLSALP